MSPALFSRNVPCLKPMTQWATSFGMASLAAIAGLGSLSIVPTHLRRVSNAHAIEASPGLCERDLSDAIATVIDHPQFQRARWGIRIETLGDATTAPRVLYDQEGDRLFIPASNVKLLTTAAALDRLGANFRIRTSVYADNATPDAVGLRLVGRGDPSLSDDDLAELARQVGDRGIRRVTSIEIDDSYFQADSVNPTWDWEDVQAGYGAPVTSLILNRNELRVVAYPGQVGQPVRLEWLDPVEETEWQVVNQTVTVPASGSGFTWVGRDFSRPILYVYGQRAIGAPPDGSSISIPDPANYGRRKLLAALERTGVNIAPEAASTLPPHDVGQLATPVTSLAKNTEVAAVLSPPLSELLIETNQNSENIYAEALLRQVGVVGVSPPPESPLQAGLVAVKEVLASLGLDPTHYALADGAGLSRQNLVSPETFVDLLQVMSRHPNAAIYRRSLAEAGLSGTLRNRFRNTPVQGRFLGKTGGLTGISSLSGYLTPPHYTPLVVSIIISHSNQSGSTRRQAIDTIVRRLAQLQPCS
ncbi:MAG: D-alanyl-D-alanine carboxypeptidase/D-alanyl-D-alanine-endopeptidase [Cyanobacteria bacterium P01_A01_bin.37]